MSSQIPSISTNPIVPIIAKRDGQSGSGQQFREQLDNQEAKAPASASTSDAESVLESANQHFRTHHASDGETGTHLDISG